MTIPLCWQGQMGAVGDPIVQSFAYGWSVAVVVRAARGTVPFALAACSTGRGFGEGSKARTAPAADWSKRHQSRTGPCSAPLGAWRSPELSPCRYVRLKQSGRVAQVVEQCPFKAWVAGSNPAALTSTSLPASKLLLRLPRRAPCGRSIRSPWTWPHSREPWHGYGRRLDWPWPQPHTLPGAPPTDNG